MLTCTITRKDKHQPLTVIVSTHPKDAVEDDEDVFEEENAAARVVLTAHVHRAVR